MTFIQLLQIIAASCLLTLTAVMLLRSVRQRLSLWLEWQLPPRHLKLSGIRRRAPPPPL
ncbi:cellulose biosynthesis protein BcsF [Pseudomonas sp. CDFA 602]|uniref:cellulose biosynthesis protein BcsF n=1 Tax=Pseudomonas californiensis TaxID=2829823 RepID=UPI001E2ADABB|nr:cellulose biosynthesis protein BcsF [Pseudomonas californiensis]MCD5995620.1 cellulose biosynthesis protein BcsF [Pseudomonas californiensis]MCD6001214.1 cellulose biosynthesis protein BcsF [Pseudomonas californiensis]